MSECLGANTRTASSRSREGWRILDFTAKLWKHPAGCSLLVPTPNRCLPNRRTPNNQGGRPARSRSRSRRETTPGSKTAAGTNSQRLIALPPHKSADYSCATRAMHTWRRLRTLLQCDLPARETIQAPAEPKPIPRQLVVAGALRNPLDGARSRS
jgi:hypothetical protein